MMNGVHLQARQSSLQRACPGSISTRRGLRGHHKWSRRPRRQPSPCGAPTV